MTGPRIGAQRGARAERALQFVRGDGADGIKPREGQNRQGDQASPAGDRVDEARDEGGADEHREG